MTETKQCPYCAYEILEIAQKCKHCNEWLNVKCPYCAELIDYHSKQCPHCNSNLELIEQNKSFEKQQKQNHKKIDEKVSDSPVVVVAKIAAKLALAILGAITLSILFPHAFDDKIEFTNPSTGEKHTIPVKKDDVLLTYKNLRAFLYNGYLIKFDATRTSNSIALTTAKYCTERENDGQEDVDKCIHNILYGGSGSTNNSQGDVMLRLFNAYNQDINKAVGRTSVQQETNIKQSPKIKEKPNETYEQNINVKHKQTKSNLIYYKYNEEFPESNEHKIQQTENLILN